MGRKGSLVMPIVDGLVVPIAPRNLRPDLLSRDSRDVHAVILVYPGLVRGGVV